LKATDYKTSLNEAQYKAVTTIYGPVLVIAGAGSGKTRTLVYRVARLIEEGIDPGSILLLTFTRKAAQEMLRRAAELVGPQSSRVNGGTFHSFCYLQLRIYSSFLGYPPNFTVLDRRDTEDLLGILTERLEFKEANRFLKKTTLASILSKARNFSQDVTWILQRNYPHLQHLGPFLDAVFSAYQKHKVRYALMDYDDLLVNWRDLLAKNEKVREKVSQRYKFIMVDEYQDTNKVQADLIRLMAYVHENVMVVGDDAQSIYSFRGANLKNILEFPKLFPGTKVIKLEYNYRSTQPNLDCANAIIANATQNFTKRLVATKKGGERPILYEAIDENDQAAFVVSRIQDLLLKGVPLHEIAVLFRSSFHSFQLEGELNRRGIRYIKRGGLKFLEGAHIKDLLSLLRILVNPLDRLGVERAFTLIPGLGKKGAERIYAAMLRAKDPLEGVLEYRTRAKWERALKDLVRALVSLRDEEIGLKETMFRIIGLYEPYCKARFLDDYPKRLQELNELAAISGEFEEPGEFLTEIALDPPEEDDIDRGRALVLSTIHSAKGCEWGAVFVISLVEGRFPSPMAIDREDDIEEERRLFYVASTRAKDHLFYVYPRLINVSKGGVIKGRRSRFLEEIPEVLLRKWNGWGSCLYDAGSKPEVHQATDDRTDGVNGFKKGARVRHHVFGPGTIIDCLGSEKVRVAFDTMGEKVINIKVVGLSVIS